MCLVCQQSHGGKVEHSLTGFNEDGRKWSVDTLLIHTSEDKHIVQLRYGCSEKRDNRQVVVEYENFIENCIETDAFEHRLVTKKGMPGVGPGCRGR
jgi:hypothetical protein